MTGSTQHPGRTARRATVRATPGGSARARWVVLAWLGVALNATAASTALLDDRTPTALTATGASAPAVVGPVLHEPLACDQRKGHAVEWTPLPSAALSDRLRDDLWQESNLHGYLGPCDAITLLPGLDRIHVDMEDPSHGDQLQCLWDLGMLGAARHQPVIDPKTGQTVPVADAVVDGVLAECQTAASAHQDGYLNDQVQGLDRQRTRGQR